MAEEKKQQAKVAAEEVKRNLTDEEMNGTTGGIILNNPTKGSGIILGSEEKTQIKSVLAQR